MKNEALINLLSSILGCGFIDIGILEGVEYDWDDVIENINNNGSEINLNNIMCEVFEMGKNELNDFIIDRIQELDIGEYGELSNDEQIEFDELQTLDVHNDIESFHNYLDTSIYFLNNEEIYKKYLKEGLDEFESKTGFRID